MGLEEDLKKLCNFALKLGAFAAKPIPTSDVVVREWVRLKCEFGCGGYGRKFHCPPYTPTPDRTKRLLKEYEWGILVGFTLPLGPYKDTNDYIPYKALVQKKHFALERKAFLAGYHKAFCFTSGPCHVCYPQKCVMRDRVRRIIHGILGLPLHCRNPKIARPPMEGSGIDVYATVQKTGLPIRVLTSRKDSPHNYGLLLVI